MLGFEGTWRFVQNLTDREYRKRKKERKESAEKWTVRWTQVRWAIVEENFWKSVNKEIESIHKTFACFARSLNLSLSHNPETICMCRYKNMQIDSFCYVREENIGHNSYVIWLKAIINTHSRRQPRIKFKPNPKNRVTETQKILRLRIFFALSPSPPPPLV